MATPVEDNNYSLAALAWATDADASTFTSPVGSADQNRSLANECGGSVTSQISMSDFMIDGWTKPADQSVAASATVTATCTFTNAETYFNSRIRHADVVTGVADTSGPFYWTESSALLSIQGGNGFGINDYTALIFCDNTGDSAQVSLQVAFRDYYNTNVANYGTDGVQTFKLTLAGNELDEGGGEEGGEQEGGRSDRRLKENIIHIGNSASGIPIYEFTYIGAPKRRYQGTMAQDLLEMNIEDAVKLNKDGYYRVLYDKIDVNFIEIQHY